VAEAQTLFSGKKELAATNTAERLTTESQVITGLLVRAAKANKAVVNIGGATVGATSYDLEAGESVQFDVIDPSRIYLYGKINDKASFLGLVP
jgi:hypothetical protein